MSCMTPFLHPDLRGNTLTPILGYGILWMNYSPPVEGATRKGGTPRLDIIEQLREERYGAP